MAAPSEVDGVSRPRGVSLALCPGEVPVEDWASGVMVAASVSGDSSPDGASTSRAVKSITGKSVSLSGEASS